MDPVARIRLALFLQVVEDIEFRYIADCLVPVVISDDRGSVR